MASSNLELHYHNSTLMSSTLDDLFLETIHEQAIGSKEVQELIDKKNKELFDIDKSSTAKFKKPDPALKPSWEKGKTRIHTKEILSQEQVDKAKQETRDKFDKEIKDEMVDKAKQEQEPEVQQRIEDMPPDNLAVLSERGPEAYKHHVRSKEFEATKEEIEQEPEKNELDIRMDDEEYENFKAREAHLDEFKDNSKEMDVDKGRSIIDDFE